MPRELVRTVDREYEEPEYQFEHSFQRHRSFERYAFPMARIDYDAMELLDVVDKGFLRIRGQKTAYAGVTSLEIYDDNKGLIRIGEYIRRNAMVDIGDKVSITKVVPKVASLVTVRMGFDKGKIIRHPYEESYVVFTPDGGIDDFYPTSLPNVLYNYLLSVGNRVSTHDFLKWWLDVEKVEPKHEVVQVNDKTKFKVLLPRKK